MVKLIKIHNYRIKFSSHKHIYTVPISNIEYINDKIFNINIFDLQINDKKINYYMFYTNPYNINNNITINFDNTGHILIVKLCNLIFIEQIQHLNEFNMELLIKIVKKKYKYKKYTDIRETFLLLWFIICKSNFINDKDLLLELLRTHYLEYINGKFNINILVDKITNCDNVNLLKFYMSFYVLLEEFHYKYIYKWFIAFDKKKLNNIVINSSYIKINPQHILTNYDGGYYPNKINLLEEIEIPFGHNSILIYNYDYIYYYDSDEQNFNEFIKIKNFFHNLSKKFINISSRKPIQTIYDDGNCIFYCLKFIHDYIQNDVFIKNQVYSAENLKSLVYKYETDICKNNNIYEWIYDFIRKKYH